MMEDNEQLRKILKQVSSVISESLSSPATMQKLEFLRDHGYQLYLIMESTSGESGQERKGPIMPITVEARSGEKRAEGERKPAGRSLTDMSSLSKSDRDFLRTLKIRVD